MQVVYPSCCGRGVELSCAGNHSACGRLVLDQKSAARKFEVFENEKFGSPKGTILELF